MRVARSNSPPPRSSTPEIVPQSLPSPHLSRRKSSSRLNLRLAYAKDSPPGSPHSLPQTDPLPMPSGYPEQPSYPLSEAVAKLDLAIDEFGTNHTIGPKPAAHTSVDNNTRVTFPRSEPDSVLASSSNPSTCKRGHRRSLASSPRSQSSHHLLPPTHQRPRTRSGSPPPVAHKSPPPPIPPIPSFLLSAAHKTTDEDGLQHIYISDMNFSYPVSSSSSDTSSPSESQNVSSPHALAHVKIFAVRHGSSSPQMA